MRIFIPIGYHSTAITTAWHVFLFYMVMLHQEFIQCLTTGSWTLRGQVYHFTSPTLQRYGYFTINGALHTRLNFEVSFENGLLYLYLDVEQASAPEERYRVLYNFCDDKITMIYEILKADKSGYEMPKEVVFEKIFFQKVVVKIPQPVREKTWAFSFGAVLHGLFRRSGQIFTGA